MCVFSERRASIFKRSYKFRFSVSVTVPQMCFLPENKSGTSPLCLFYRQYREEAELCKIISKGHCGFKVECHSLPQHAWPLTSPPYSCFPDNKCRKLTENSGISSCLGREFWKSWLSNTITLMEKTDNQCELLFSKPEFSRHHYNLYWAKKRKPYNRRNKTKNEEWK